MSKLPEKHEQYPLLLGTRDSDFEVFSYPHLGEMNNLGEENLEPYGYSSLQEYLDYLDERKAKASLEVARLFDQLKEKMVEMNKKEEWSILLYKGNGNGEWPERLINGRAYYWPCSEANPVYDGIIDEEEWTSHWYPTEPDDWEILEDPTGMAYRTLYCGENHVSRENYEHVMNQLKELRKE
ncbi:MAG: hypothetical protein K6B42_02175 [Clostridia bacterium]|nr:hypothetical protein [Clostridia bacterium]